MSFVECFKIVLVAVEADICQVLVAEDVELNGRLVAVVADAGNLASVFNVASRVRRDGF